MKKLLPLFLIMPLMSIAQFEDNFSDGNFTENPQWFGNNDLFIVNTDHQLQLNDNQEATAYLSTPNIRLDSTEWHFTIKLGFSPSANNNARVYLAAGQGNPDNTGASYFLQFGESGSDDAITLYKFVSGNKTEICRGTEGLISSSFSMGVKVTYDNSGNWKIFTDPMNSGLFELEASGYSDSQINPQYFSIQCNYTISNSDDFFFDDFVVKPLEKDITPPAVEKAEAISAYELSLEFNESLTALSAEKISNYNLNHGIGEPEAAVLDANIPNKVYLTFSSAFQDHTTYLLTINNVEDLNGNILLSDEISFEYLRPYYPETYEVVINEIMADVNPEPNELPAYDYVELYNRTNKLIDLSGSFLTFGSHKKHFPANTFIHPNSYLLLTDDDSPLELSALIHFSSFPVNNETRMTLSDSSENIIHTINYKKEWYDDEEKEDGGWSLEIIDPDNPCGCAGNWSASSGPEGGTPGKVNSIDAKNPDEIAPAISNVKILNDFSIKIFFSESMNGRSLSDKSFYRLKEPELTPRQVQLNPPDYTSVRLLFGPETFTNEKLYRLNISEQIHDCSENVVENLSYSFANYEPQYGDLIIQEIMADVNPEPRELPPVEYFEIYNRSNFPIDMTSVYVKAGNRLIDFNEGRAIEPGSFLIVSENYPGLEENKNLYLIPHIGIANGGDEITIYESNGDIIFYTAFDVSWYDDETKEQGGWSLEMIDQNNYCAKNKNWTASINASGGTPGFENSVKAENKDSWPPDIKIIAVTSPHTIILYFDERIDNSSMKNPDAYTYSSSLGNITSITPVEPAFERVEIVFEKEIKSDAVYSISVSNQIKDCVGNGLLVSEPLKFSYPILADTNDLVINEILFNPKDQGVDFLELYNKSLHAIDVSSLYVKLLDPFSGELKKQSLLTGENLVFMKNHYLVLTENPEVIVKHYPKAKARNILQVPNMPNFPNNTGQIIVSDIQNKTLDNVIYSEDMHFPLINLTDGVSLERVDPAKSSKDQDNWHSASEMSGFATPGYKNSQSSKQIKDNLNISVTPEIVTPNNDGKDDQMQISYKFDNPGFSTTVVIYDAKGREVIRLFNNKQLGTSGNLFWDGTNTDKKLVQTGYYVVLIEIFDLEGNLKSFKKAVAVAGI